MKNRVILSAAKDPTKLAENGKLEICFMDEALMILPSRPKRKRRMRTILGGAVTAVAAVLVAALAVPAGVLLCLACLVWNLADRILDALDR